MRPIKGLQLILSVAIMVSVWGCFLSLFVLTWYGFLDPLIGAMEISQTVIEMVLIEVSLVLTVAWLAWLFPPLGNAFKTVFWFGFSLIGALLGIRQQQRIIGARIVIVQIFRCGVGCRKQFIQSYVKTHCT